MNTLTRVLVCTMPVAMFGCGDEIKIEDVVKEIATNRDHVNSLIDPAAGRVPKLEARVDDLETWRKEKVNPALGGLGGHAAPPAAVAPPAAPVATRGRFVRNGRYASGVWYGDMVAPGQSVSLSDHVQRTVENAAAIKNGNDKLEEMFGGKEARKKVEELREEVERLKRQLISLRARNRGHAADADAKVQKLEQEVKKLQEELKKAQSAASSARDDTVVKALEKQTEAVQEFLKELRGLTTAPSAPGAAASPKASPKVNLSGYVTREEFCDHIKVNEERWNEHGKVHEGLNKTIADLVNIVNALDRRVEEIDKRVAELDAPPKATPGRPPTVKQQADCCAAIQKALNEHLKEFRALKEKVEGLAMQLRGSEAKTSMSLPNDVILRVEKHEKMLNDLQIKIAELPDCPPGVDPDMFVTRDEFVAYKNAAIKERLKIKQKVNEGVGTAIAEAKATLYTLRTHFVGRRPPAGTVPPVEMLKPSDGFKVFQDLRDETEHLVPKRTSSATGPMGTDAAYYTKKGYHLRFSK